MGTIADDSLQTGADTIATDHVTTLNGVAVTQTASSPKVQRVKVAYGDDNTSRDVSLAFPLPTAPPPSTLTVTATAAAATIATASLPAAAGLFHYITSIQISLYSSVARTGAAAPWVVTSTNLPGSPAWTFSTAGAVGTNETQVLAIPAAPLKATAASTITTVAGPAATGGIWRITVTYFTAA